MDIKQKVKIANENIRKYIKTLNLSYLDSTKSEVIINEMDKIFIETLNNF